MPFYLIIMKSITITQINIGDYIMFDRLTDFFSSNAGYIIGGSIVIGSFLYLFYPFSSDAFPASSFNIIFILLLLGFALGVGFAIRDIMWFFGVVPIVPPNDPPNYIKNLYKKFYPLKEWECIPRHFDFYDEHKKFLDNQKGRIVEFYHRTGFLKDYCTSVGSNGLIASLFLFTKGLSGLIRGNMTLLCSNSFDFWLSVFLLIISLALILLGWLNAAIQIQLLFKYRI